MARRILGAEYHPRWLIVLAAALAALGFAGTWGAGQIAQDSGAETRAGGGAVATEVVAAQSDQLAAGTRSSGQRAAGNERSGQQAAGDGPRAQDAGDPVRLEISVSGDILIHSPIYRRALANGNGSYDFRPMFRKIRPVIRGADLSICHLETTLTKAPPSSFPIFATPAPLADAIAAAGWDACSTASNHSLDKGLAGIRTTEKALNRAGLAHTGSASSGPRSTVRF